MRILAIETSCDETAIALVRASGGLRAPRFEVLKNLVASQIETHRPYGGVVPNLAKREHQKNLPVILRRLNLNKYGGSTSIDLIAVTVGPGLEPCLWTGIEFAKNLAKEIKKPLLGANHMEAHLYSNWLPQGKSHPERKRRISRDSSSALRRTQNDKDIKFPAVALLVSGGHTILLKMDSLVKWKKLGETRDDAAGEAFDKVARLLGLPYPGGPEIEKLAIYGRPTSIDFPRPMINAKNYEFSFSGLKTAVLYYLRDHFNLGTSDVQNIAASFQQAIVDVLVKKTIRAAIQYGSKSVLLSGGVAANRALREQLALGTKRFALRFHVPFFEYNTDNAAMIAAAAYISHLRKKKLRLTAQPNLNL